MKRNIETGSSTAFRVGRNEKQLYVEGKLQRARSFCSLPKHRYPCVPSADVLGRLHLTIQYSIQLLSEHYTILNGSSRFDGNIHNH